MKAVKKVAVPVPENARKREGDVHHTDGTNSENTTYGKPERRFQTGVIMVVVAAVGILAFFFFQPRADEFRTAEQPVECDSEGCRQLRLFLLSTVNKSADPCHDFFSFTCAAQLEKERMSLMSDAINSKVQAMVLEASIPERGQTAFEKAVAMQRACVSLYSKNRSEAAHLRHFLARHGLDAANLDLSRDPLDSMVQLSLSWGLPAIVAISEAAGSRLDYPHEMAFSSLESEWYRDRQEHVENKTYERLVDENLRFLFEYKGDDFIDELEANITSAETKVASFLLNEYENAKQKKEESYYLIRVKDVPKYLDNVVSSGEWSTMVMSYSDGIYRMSDQMMLERLGVRLTVFMLNKLDRAEALLLISWSVVRQLAPHANGAARNGSPAETHEFCYEGVRYLLEAALASNVIYRTITPDVLREVTYMGFRVRETIATTVGTSSWLSSAARKAARRKAEAMRLTVAFPYNLTRLAALERFYAEMPEVPIRDSSFLLSWLNASRFVRRVRMRHQGEILFPLGSVNAMHTYSTNTVNLAGGLIQPVLYFHGTPAGFNYGGIGQIIGHEMMHSFDVAGRSVDETGAPSDWWPEQATDKYVEQTWCLRTMHREALRKRALVLDPILDSEDLADIMGTRAAFDAFWSLGVPDSSSAREASSARQIANITGNFVGFTYRQLFFIGHCAKMCDPTVPPRERDTSVPYSPNWARCVVPLMNMPEFADAFHCAEGTFMNPKLKCRFW